MEPVNNPDNPHPASSVRLQDIHLSHFTATCFALANYMAWLAAPLKGLRLHASSLEMGIITTTAGAVYAVVCIASLRLSSRLPPRGAILVGCVANTLTFLAAATIVHTIPSLILMVTVLGATWAMFWPHLMSWMSRTVPRSHLARELGNFNQSWCLGDIAGGLLAGCIAQHLSICAVFYCSAVLTALAFIVTLRRHGIPPESRGQASAPSEAAITGSGKPVSFPANLRYVFVGWIGLAVGFLATGCFNGLFPYIARQRADFSDSVIGGCFAFMGVCQLLTFHTLKKRTGWHYRFWAVVVAHICFITALLTLAVAHHPASFLTAAVVCPVGIAMCYTFSIFYGAMGHIRKSTAMSVHEGILGGGLFGGGLLGGWMGKRFGLVTPFVVVSLVILLVAVVQYWIGWRKVPLIPCRDVTGRDTPSCGVSIDH